jgi:preprotein translocase subunit YajC
VLYVLLAFVLLLFVFSSVQNKKRRAHAQQLTESLTPGVRVLMTSGIYGILVEVETDTVVVEISEGVDVRFKKAAVMSVVPHLDEDDDQIPGGEHTDGEHTDDEPADGGHRRVRAGVDAAELDDDALHAELDSLSAADTPAGERTGDRPDKEARGKKRGGHEPGGGPVPTA